MCLHNHKGIAPYVFVHDHCQCLDTTAAMTEGGDRLYLTTPVIHSSVNVSQHLWKNTHCFARVGNIENKLLVNALTWIVESLGALYIIGVRVGVGEGDEVSIQIDLQWK